VTPVVSIQIKDQVISRKRAKTGGIVTTVAENIRGHL